MDTTHLAQAPANVTIRRNVPLRLAGAGYAAITFLWLTATIGRVSGAEVGQALFLLLTLTGVVLALYRDDVRVDAGERSIEVVKGFPLFLRRSHYKLSEFDRLTVQEDAIDEFEDGAIRPVQRAWVSVVLSDGHGRTVPIWSGHSDESNPARTRLRATATQKAETFSSLVGLPVV